MIPEILIELDAEMVRDLALDICAEELCGCITGTTEEGKEFVININHRLLDVDDTSIKEEEVGEC